MIGSIPSGHGILRPIEKIQNFEVDTVVVFNWQQMGCAGDDGFATAWNGFGQLVCVLALNGIILTSHDKSRSLDLSEIIQRLVRLRPPHCKDPAVKIGPLARVRRDKPVTKCDTWHFVD